MPLPAKFTLLQVIPELETGGAEQTTLDVAAAVIAAGGRAIVATRGGRMEPKLKAAGAKIVHLPVQSKNPLVMLTNALSLMALIRREKVSLVHARSRAPAFSALMAARATARPFLATYHGVYNAKGRFKRWYNAVMTKGDLVIANSSFTRDHVVAQHGVDPASVIAIPRGVDLARFDPEAVAPERIRALEDAWGLAADDKRVRILLAGRLTRWKGQVLLIAAADRLSQDGRDDFVIILAGDDQGRSGYRAELESDINDAALEERVLIVGHCSDMPAAYLACDIAVAPSLDPEAFGRTAVEPQVMGRPVIAADHGAARETVENGVTGWLAKPGDVASWTKALHAALSAGRQRRADMGQAARERARRLYSVEAMTKATLEVYRRILESRV